ncbi:Do family serine endopeptidase [Aquamicrobium segne]|uniref:Do family serine endopeptidase n=1 Tax=Aquamicrobium segne TaxID=469547 RepID=A0ABW0GWA4_9HYPH
MTRNSKTISSRSRRLTVAAASLAIAGATGLAAVTATIEPVLAEAVRVEAPQVPSFADVVSSVSPAVVSVRVKASPERTADRGSAFGLPDEGFGNLPPNHPMRRFFREFRGFGDGKNQPRAERRGPAKPRPVSQGSGFFISADGYLVTNNHVVDRGSEFTIVTNDGTELDARLVGKDERTDLAVLKVDSDLEFTYVDFAEDAKIRVGDWVVAVGNPFGLGGTVTAGIISARGRDIGAGPYDDFIQIDAAVNRGNSGGPAFDLSGQVVGINTAIFSPSGGNVGIAFAIPSSTAKQVVEGLIKDGSVARGWLGVEIQPVTRDIAESLGLKFDKGAIVANAQDDSPATKAGIVSGDVITQVDGHDIASSRDLARIIAAYAPDTQVDITVWRDGKSQDINVKLGKLPGDQTQAAASPGASTPSTDTLGDLGLTVTTADDGKGLVVTGVDPDSDAADRGVMTGDVIVAVNSEMIASVEDVSKAIDAAAKAGRKSVLLQISRDSNNRFVALPIDRG